jgi:hypothetical protein
MTEPSGAFPRLERVAASSLFAYATILALQAKVLWGIWDHRDLPVGDTLYYFTDASRWAEHLQLNPDYYPAYHVVWGSLQWLIDGAFEVTIVHRVLIALAVAALVLAVLRRLLTPGIAWVMAAWWAVLPVNYDTVYEVHLFAVIPMLGAVLIALHWKGLGMRATVFGILLASAILTRNENIAAAIAWAAIWIGCEVRLAHSGEGTRARDLVVAAAVPLVICVAMLPVISSRSNEVDAGSSVSEQFEAKHLLNVCQFYAFGEWQRDDETGVEPLSSPTACQTYMREDFGAPELTLTEAIRESPGAMAEHFGWNLALLPSGLQVMFFNETWPHGPTPDFLSVREGTVLTLIGSLALLGFAVYGLIAVWREREWWWPNWIRERAWGWAALLCLAVASSSVILVTRPRASYLFTLTVLGMAVLGMAAMVLVRRRPGLARLSAAVPVLAIVLILLVPPHYQRGYSAPLVGTGQHLREAVDRLEPFEDQLRGADVRLLAPSPLEAACVYVGRDDPCTGVIWEAPPGRSLERELSGDGFDYVYVSEEQLSKPAWQAAIAALQASGRWERLAPGPAEDDGWLLLGRVGG